MRSIWDELIDFGQWAVSGTLGTRKMAIATEICQPEWPSHGQAPGKKMASGIRRDIYHASIVG